MLNDLERVGSFEQFQKTDARHIPLVLGLALGGLAAWWGDYFTFEVPPTWLGERLLAFPTVLCFWVTGSRTGAFAGVVLGVAGVCALGMIAGFWLLNRILLEPWQSRQFVAKHERHSRNIQRAFEARHGP